MKRTQHVTNLEELIVLLNRAGQKHDHVSVSSLLDAVGRRSFGPLLLFAGLIALSPLGVIPSVPTMVAVSVMLIVGQLLCGRKQFWLPRFVVRR